MLLGPPGAPPGPPPQTAINCRLLWYVLILLLSTVGVIRFLTFDIIGGLLYGLLACMVTMMVKDGMQELARYSLMFTVLCLLCLFFDSIPLIASLGGRSQAVTVPLGAEITMEGQEVKRVYSVSMKTTPFFDPKLGFQYNVESLGMVLAPLSMLLGACLSASAQMEIRARENANNTNGNQMPWYAALGGGDPEERRPLREQQVREQQENAEPPEVQRPGPQDRPSGHHFTGTPYRLSDHASDC